ncbi:MAG: ABC-2 type transport system ATP-binding protein, partial [Natronomonas sp.]
KGPLSELRERYGETTYHVFTTVEVPGATAEGDRYRRVVDDMEALEAVRADAIERGGALDDVRTVEPSLEGLFLDVAASDGRTAPETMEG